MLDDTRIVDLIINLEDNTSNPLANDDMIMYDELGLCLITTISHY